MHLGYKNKVWVVKQRYYGGTVLVLDGESDNPGKTLCGSRHVTSMLITSDVSWIQMMGPYGISMCHPMYCPVFYTSLVNYFL